MTIREIKENLCNYDLRNPDGIKSYAPDCDDISSCGNHRRKDCYCDNCFYNRVDLAEELLKTQND